MNRMHFPSDGTRARAVVATLVFLWWLGMPGVARADAAAFAEAVGRGPLYAAGVALLGGLLVSLTPCVYPMIAITVSVFGARRARSRSQGLALSSTFVLGIMAMFIPLGVVAGMTGSLFGAVLQNRWVVVAIACLFLAMAASMFGAFDTALPSGLVNRLAQFGGSGLRGAFGLGLVCGLVAAPCTGPVLTGILTWIAQNQSAVGGGLAMTAFSLGLGFPFFLMGAFAVQLPKGGRWMVHVKSVLAMLLAVVALYYLDNAFPALGQWFPTGTVLYVVAGLALVGGLALGAVHRDFSSPSLGDRLLKSGGAFVVTLASFGLVTAGGQAEQSMGWRNLPFDDAMAAARSEQRPLMVDVTAAWCSSCKQLDNVTFADPQVAREAGRFVAIKLDATDDDDPQVNRLLSRLAVVGLPTVVLFDSEGREARRLTDFVEPDAFLEALATVE